MGWRAGTESGPYREARNYLYLGTFFPYQFARNMPSLSYLCSILLQLRLSSTFGL